MYMKQIVSTDVEPQHARLLARYRVLRAFARRQSDAFVNYLSKDAIVKGARRLGLCDSGRTICFENESETDVLLDYCIYDHRDLAAGKQSRTAVERFAVQARPRPGTDELVMLEAALAARYTVLLVKKAVPGVGVEVTDALRGQPFLLVDVGLSTTAVPGLGLATRVMMADGIHMTTGAALPILDRQVLDDVRAELFAALGDEP